MPNTHPRQITTDIRPQTRQNSQQNISSVPVSVFPLPRNSTAPQSSDDASQDFFSFPSIMAPSLLGFLILILLPSPSLARSTPSAIDSKLCGSDRVAYEESAAGYRLIINERIVDDPLLICAALESYSASGCFAAILRECCDRDTYGRRGFLEVAAAAAAPDQGNLTPEEGRRHRGIEKKDFAVPGMLLLCCAVICPCFRPRRRSVGEHHTLSKELSSMDSVSSLDINSASEKTPGTPLRIPPSPARVPPSPSRFSISPQLNRVGSIHLSVGQIYKATQNFSPSMRLGEGGFGTVYKAVLPDGQVVAIKRAKKEHLSTLRDEFSNEVELLSKIEHRSLVKLLGYTEKGNERIIITEHVPNGTLREHLDGQHGKILDFNQRLEISIDVAHALTYLHLYAEKTIIHRDVKSSNILLTENYRAKVSDFGFAKGSSETDQTHIMTKVKGTAGYLDPEYLQTYQLTPKSDVFSFGILLIEIISGRRPVELKRAIEERITVRWAFKLYNEGNLRGILDPLLNEAVDKEVLTKMIGLAFECAAPTRVDRPVMTEVAKQLWEIRKDYGRCRGG